MSIIVCLKIFLSYPGAFLLFNLLIAFFTSSLLIPYKKCCCFAECFPVEQVVNLRCGGGGI